LEEPPAKVAPGESLAPVIQSIDELKTELKNENIADEVKLDGCKKQYTELKSIKADYEWRVKKNNAKINKLEALIQKLGDEKTETQDEKTAVEDLMTKLTADRTAEHGDFEQTVQDDKDAIQLLGQAKDALAEFSTNNNLGFIQNSAKGEPAFERSADDAPDAALSDKGSNAGASKNILTLMTMIVNNLNNEIKTANTVEKNAQLEYEKQYAASKTLKGKLGDKILSLGQAITDRGEDKTEEEGEKTNNQQKVDDADSDLTEIKGTEEDPGCDHIIENFAKRVETRQKEIDGLIEAKEHLDDEASSPAETPPSEGAFLEGQHGSRSSGSSAFMQATKFVALDQ